MLGQPAPILPYSFFAKSSAKLLHFLNSTKLFCTPSKVLRCITSCISNIAVTSLAKVSAKPLHIFNVLFFKCFCLTSIKDIPHAMHSQPSLFYRVTILASTNFLLLFYFMKV